MSDAWCYQIYQLARAAGGMIMGRRETWEEFEMGLNEARNAMKARVLTDLNAIWKKLADDPVVPDYLRAQAREMVEEFNDLVGDRGRGDAGELFWGETLFMRMARLLPSLNEVHTTPEDARGIIQE